MGFWVVVAGAAGTYLFHDTKVNSANQVGGLFDESAYAHPPSNDTDGNHITKLPVDNHYQNKASPSVHSLISKEILNGPQ